MRAPSLRGEQLYISLIDRSDNPSDPLHAMEKSTFLLTEPLTGTAH
ncbi:MAG TPA: hypothetical protein VM911_19490 [Pyrinomonadaceae bacterium]|nr:hypothetical protein [Pyrinomonadaceae bacterium]